jgi:DNA-binding IclR family transcriptional regulator
MADAEIVNVTEAIITTLARSNDGLTCAEVAALTGMPAKNVSGKLSKMAAYGWIRSSRRNSRVLTRYHFKPEQHHE